MWRRYKRKEPSASQVPLLISLTLASIVFSVDLMIPDDSVSMGFAYSGILLLLYYSVNKFYYFSYVAVATLFIVIGAFIPFPAADEMPVTFGNRGLSIVMLWGMAHLFTYKLKSETALCSALDAAKAASESKSAFLAMMSHEIRTPLTGVIGMADILADTPLNEDQLSYIDTMRLSAKSLLTILNDVLDYSKIEANCLRVDRADFDAVKLTSEVVRLFSARAVENGNSLTLDTGDIKALVVNGDAIRIKQVLVNLVGNAVKFTNSGSITVRMRQISISDSLTLLFEVEDTGIGISEADMNRLFQPFSQINDGATRRFTGTGLGLSISKRLAGLMGGGLSVSSQLGRGTCFRFTCPVDHGSPVNSAITAQPTNTVAPMTVLLAEDNPINRMIVRIGLEQRGHHVTAVENGLQACASATQQRFNLILMDMQMPVMDGVEATRRIRILPPPFSDVPIVALTADALPEHRATYMEAGLTDFLTKPVEWNEVDAVLARLYNGNMGYRDTESCALTAGALWVASDGDNIPLFDRQKLITIRNQMKLPVFDELIIDFISSSEIKISELEEAVKRHNLNLIHAAAHALRGMFSNFGGIRVAELTHKLQACTEIESASCIVPVIVAAIRDSIKYLQQLDFWPSADDGVLD